MNDANEPVEPHATPMPPGVGIGGGTLTGGPKGGERGKEKGAEEPSGGRMAMPQPKPRHRLGPVDVEGAVGSGSATGFVSMLAKRQFDPEAADALAATAEDEAMRRERLHMAREVSLPTGGAATDAGGAEEAGALAGRAERGSSGVRVVPGWYRVGLVAALVLAVLLLGIGAWAIGALVYMARVMPLAAKDVHYPLISWRLDVGNMGGYTAASRVMAWAMLMCVPVAGLLVVMAGMIWKRIKG